MIGSLFYLSANRPNLCYSVGIICVRYQANPKESHMFGIKKIIKYISGTIEFGLWYLCDSMITLMKYCDVDWAENFDDRKRTLGRCFFLGNNLVSLFSKMQSCISLSITEVEYKLVEVFYRA